MRSASEWLLEPGVGPAVELLRKAVLAHYPAATFRLDAGDDPEGIYIIATIDVEDSTEVIEAIIDPLLEVQIDRYLPVYVIALRPPDASEDEGVQQVTAVA